MDNDKVFLNLCIKYQKQLLLIFNVEVFSIKNGKAVLNFDEDGRLREIEKMEKHRPIKEKG